MSEAFEQVSILLDWKNTIQYFVDCKWNFEVNVVINWQPIAIFQNICKVSDPFVPITRGCHNSLHSGL